MKKKETTEIVQSEEAEVFVGEQTAETGEIMVESETDTLKAEPTAEAVGVWVYVGPSIRGIITNGGIFRGTKSDILSGLPEGWKKYPKIERLIVSDKSLAVAREQLRQGKGGVSVAYNAVAAELAAKEG